MSFLRGGGLLNGIKGRMGTTVKKRLNAGWREVFCWMRKETSCCAEDADLRVPYRAAFLCCILCLRSYAVFYYCMWYPTLKMTLFLFFTFSRCWNYWRHFRSVTFGVNKVFVPARPCGIQAECCGLPGLHLTEMEFWDCWEQEGNLLWKFLT